MASQTAVEREILTWSRFGDATIELAEQIAASGYRPDIVLAVARGGLTVAGALAYALSVKNCFAMNVEFYTGVEERLDVPVVLAPTLDVADTGETLALVRNVIRPHVADARCAVLYQKGRSIVDCEYVWQHTDLWINFPWSSRPPVVGGPSTDA
jgi:hypoxanthine phosphoribosyltransferase